MKRIAILASTGCLIAQAALAHAHLRTATPGADSVVTLAPQDVAINLTEGVEPAFSTIEVTGPSGRRVDKGAAYLVDGDAKRLAIGVAPLTPGTYTVTWHATSVDTHKTEGTYQFIVAAPDASGISLEHAWARPTAGAGSTGAPYLTVTDNGQPDRIVGASTPVAALAHVHETTDDHGVMKMRDLDGVSLEPGKPVVFRPGGYHVMLTGLKAPLKHGDTFPLTLTFEHAQPLTVTVKVESGPGGGNAHDHAGMEGMHDHMEH